MDSCLVLNADYTPLRVDSWQRGLGLVLDEKAALVTAYGDRKLRSAAMAFPWPAVIALKRYSKFRSTARFSRRNVLARDGWTCQYCGAKPRTVSGRPDLQALSIDHVVPRAQSSNNRVVLPWSGARVPLSGWTNVATACLPCNRVKAARTPQEAKMKLTRIPGTPGHMDLLRMALSPFVVPTEWEDFLPARR